MKQINRTSFTLAPELIARVENSLQKNLENVRSKIPSKQEIDYNDIGSLTAVIRKSNSVPLKKEAVLLLVSILDKKCSKKLSEEKGIIQITLRTIAQNPEKIDKESTRKIVDFLANTKVKVYRIYALSALRKIKKAQALQPDIEELFQKYEKISIRGVSTPSMISASKPGSLSVLNEVQKETSKIKIVSSAISESLKPTSIDQFVAAPLIALRPSGIKDRTTIIDELKVQNKNNREFLAWLESAQASLEHIDIILSKDSKLLPQGKAIENWSKKEIFTWTRSVKRSSKSIDQEELVAVANQAVRLYKGYSPRDTQLLSVLALLNKKSGYGRLIQVKTGEGKTTIAGMTAVIAALQIKKPIDIVTSSSVLAKRDSAEQAPYYSLFGLSCRHINKSESTGAKECYLADILYGSASDFEGDYLRDVFKGQGTRIGREFSTVIVDEVDSMLVDEGAKITKLTTPRPGAEYLTPIFILTWKAIEDLNITEEMLSNSEIKENLERRIEEHIEIILSSGHFVYPNYLQDYIYSQVGEWSKSALLASYMQEDVHYVINYDEDSKSKVISPVDYVNSGVIQSKTTWGNGVHQFLQVKHSLKMTSDSITTSFMSNMSFFLKYGSNIMGMTGTLGSDRSKDLLSDTYNLDSAVIPKFKTNLFIEQEGVVVIDESEHKNTIIDSAINEASRGRVILIIAKTIVFAKDLAKALGEVYSSSKMHTYTHNEDSEAVEDIKQAGDIIVATNLAGRGTDIKLSEETIANGGLHVIITDLTSNKRIEQQAFGRSARQGAPGTGIIIINGKADAKNLRLTYDGSLSIEDFKAARDLVERQRLEHIVRVKLPEVSFEDYLFNRFNNEIYQLLKNENDNKFKLAQLEESWGFWLKFAKQGKEEDFSTEVGKQIEAQFEIFKQQEIEKYRSDRPTNNPVYQIHMGHSLLGHKNSYDKSIKLLEQVSTTEDPFSFAGHYYLAYAYLRKNLTGKGEDHSALIAGAYRHLNIAKIHIEEVIIPQLQAMQMMLPVNSAGSSLSNQIINKIDLLNHQLNYINHAIEFLDSNAGSQTVKTVGRTHLFKDLYPQDKAPSLEIRDLNRLGAFQLYELDAKKIPKDVLSSVVVSLIGVGQVIFGTMAAIASGGTLGVNMIVSGLRDAYQGIDAALKGEGINLGDYFKAKAIDAAIDFISQGAANKISPAKIAGQQVTKQAAKEAAKVTVGQVMFRVGFQIGTRLATDQAVKVASKHLTKTALKKSIGAEIKEARRTIIARLTSPNIHDSLENILAIDPIYNGEYSRRLSEAVSGFMTKKSGELESIATSIITSTFDKAASNTGSGAAKAFVATIGVAAKVASSYGRITKLADDFCDHMESAILEIAGTLPDHAAILRKNVPAIDEYNSRRVIGIFEKAGIIIGPWELDESLVFRSGISQITKRESNKEPQSSSPVPMQLSDLSKEDVKAPSVTRKHMNLLNLGANLRRHTIRIQQVIEKMQRSFARRGELSEPLVHSYADMIENRIRGQFRHAVVSPAVSTAATMGMIPLQKEIMAHIESQYFVEKTKQDIAIGAGVTGVAAGDSVEEVIIDQPEEDSSDEEDIGAGLSDPRWYDEYGNLLPIEQRPYRNRGTIMDTQHGPILIPGTFPLTLTPTGGRMVDGTNVDNSYFEVPGFFEKLSDTYDHYYKESITNTERRKNISSWGLFETRSREIDRNVVRIEGGSGSMVFKSFARLNEETGGAMRYMLDQISHSTHQLAPKPMAMIDGTISTLGHVVGEGIREVTPGFVLDAATSAHTAIIEAYPSENQRFLLSVPAGIVAAEFGAGGLKLAITKTGSATKQLVHISQEALQYLSNTSRKLMAGVDGRRGMRMLESLELLDSKRNFTTSKKWSRFTEYVEHMEKKLPNASDMVTTYPKGGDTKGIRKAWSNGQHEIVIKRAKPDSIYPSQHVDYVSIQSNGQVMARDGSFIVKGSDGLYRQLPKKHDPLAPDPKTSVRLPDLEGVFDAASHPNAHIPLDEWLKWKTWNKS